tara:strand:- start:82 stop:738 length:657 start_codon:yes stop_codon:yes gene_type:complete
MIIEFTGIPCSGKSYIIKKFLENTNTSVHFIKKHKYNIFFNFSLFFNYLLLLSKGKGNFFIIRLIIFGKHSINSKIRLIYNYIKKVVLYWKYSRRKGIYLFDEGISHVIFNVLVNSGSSKISLDNFHKIQSSLPKIDLLVLVDVDYKTAKKRLLNRGHKRFSETPSFLLKNINVCNLLKKNNSYYENFFIIKNNDTNLNYELNKLSKYIKHKIKKCTS